MKKPKNQEDGSESSTDDTVTILIKTKNFGNVKVVLTLVTSHKIDMQINCSNEFPKEELEELFKRDCDGYCIDTNVQFLEQIVSKDDDNSTETKINMNTSPKLSPYLLLASHSIIRSVIDIDKRYSLVSNRANMK